jgi:hypothetical protein
VGIQPTMGQAALLASGTNLATAVPSAPGYVGTFELAAVTIAASVGISRTSAFAFAVLVHVTALAVTSIGGVISYVLGQRARVRRLSTAPAAPADHRGAGDERHGAEDRRAEEVVRTEGI